MTSEREGLSVDSNKYSMIQVMSAKLKQFITPAYDYKQASIGNLYFTSVFAGELNWDESKLDWDFLKLGWFEMGFRKQYFNSI